MNKIKFAYLFIIFVILLLVGCSQNHSVDGGGGIETVAKIGKIIDEDGNPASSVQVKSFPSEYNPLSDLLGNKVYLDTTNDSGFYEIKVIKNGKHNIIASSLINNYSVMLKDITEESLLDQDTLKQAGTMAVYIPDWLKDDSGYVFIPGTDIYASLSDTTENGVLLLENVPVGTIDQVVYYDENSGSDTSIFDEKNITISSNDTIVMQAFGLIKRYSVSSGHLPSDRVHSIERDIYGNKWYATADGVVKCDGIKWATFTNNTSNLKVNHVYDLWASNTGEVWAGTVGGGLACYDGNEWKSYDQTNSNIVNDSVYVVCGCSACGGIWLGTDYGLMYKPASSDSIWDHYHTENSALVGDSIFSLVLNTCGHMFIGTDKGVSFWDGETWTIWTPENSGLPGRVVYGLVDGLDGTIWAATNNGVAMYSDSSWEKIIPPVNEYDEMYRALAKSADGEIWAVSSGIGTILRSKNGMKLLLTAEDLGMQYDFVRINDVFPHNSNGEVEVATQYDGVLVLGKTDRPASRLSLRNISPRRYNNTRRF